MFKILIVEDDTTKLRYIIQHLESISGVNKDDIHHEIDSQSAKLRLKDNFYDLMIVDIAIPNRKSEAAETDGGIKLVHEVLQRDIYKTPSHIVGLTAFDEVFTEAVKEFGNQIISVMRYSDSDDEWKDALSNGITQWMAAKNSSYSMMAEYQYDVAIITAVDVEFKAIKALSDSWQRVIHPNDPTVYFECYFDNSYKRIRVIAACASQMGMTASAVLSMKLIYNFRPRYLFMTGIAATLKDNKNHGFGDIIVIDETWDGGAGKITETEDGVRVFKPVALHLRSDKDLSEKLQALKENTVLLRKIKDDFKPNSVPNTELSIHIGSAVSVAGVIENKEVVDELLSKDRKLVGLEMESYGMYYSANNCSKPRPKAIALKAISDFASPTKDDEFQTYAAYTSSRVLLHLILNECEYST